MRRLWTLVLLCSMGMVAAACGSDDSDGGGNAGGSGGSAGSSSASIGDFFGSCAYNDGSQCNDEYCAGSMCATYQPDRQSKCDGEKTWSTTKCKDGAQKSCKVVNKVGGIFTVWMHYYTDLPSNLETACSMAGGTLE